MYVYTHVVIKIGTTKIFHKNLYFKIFYEQKLKII